MRLSSQHPRHFRRERRWLGVGLLGLAGLLLFALWPSGTPTSYSTSAVDLVCDAERVRGDYFYNKEHKFAGGNYRSTQQARSGKASLLFPADGQTHFGFSTQLKNVAPGQRYELRVWSFNNQNGAARLAVQGQNPTGFYQETYAAEQTDERGWQEHVLRFHIPFRAAPQDLNLYVYSNGQAEVYFDDFQLRTLERWAAEDFTPRRLYLELDAKALQQLENKRLAALRKGLLQTADEDWVKAQMRVDSGQTLAAKVRLKGDWLDHLRGDKWSFRVALKEEQTWRGMTTFSLHTPAARYFLHEWLLHQWWEAQDVLTTRYDFVELMVNGTSKGIYAYEEHFEKQLVESRQRREGPILKYDEDGFWAGNARQLAHHGFVRPGSGHRSQAWENAPVATFNAAELAADTLQNAYAQRAKAMLASFRDGTAKPAEVFDLPLLARFYLGCDLLNAYHGLTWHNQRFYYNPITALLEPIGFDGFADRPSERYHFLAEGALHPQQQFSAGLPAQLLQDSTFIAEYLAAAWELSQPANWTAFWQNQEAAWTARLQWLQLEFPDYRPAVETMAAEVAFVRSHLLPFAPTSIRAQRHNGATSLSNTHTLPIIIQGYGRTDKGMDASVIPTILPAAPLRRLDQRLRQETTPLNFQSINFWEEQALAEQGVTAVRNLNIPRSSRYLYYQLLGLDSTLVGQINWQAEADVLLSPSGELLASKPQDFPTLQWQNQLIHIPEGTHVFEQDLIVPPGTRLQIAAGATIYLEQNSAIYCRAAVQAVGTEEAPILISSQDGTGQGLVVQRAPTTSLLHRVAFRNLSAWQRRDWQLTGAVTFYESSVSMDHCLFADNKSEDALNTIRSEIAISNCVFSQTASDGFDSDFCKGTLTGCVFRNTGNDGLDISGSILTARDCQFQGCGDKRPG
ncbi:MAG: CotH kinase family protein, partial [Bacteroidota bacterium]